jgi:hypothetical protein
VNDGHLSTKRLCRLNLMSSLLRNESQHQNANPVFHHACKALARLLMVSNIIGCVKIFQDNDLTQTYEWIYIRSERANQRRNDLQELSSDEFFITIGFDLLRRCDI